MKNKRIATEIIWSDKASRQVIQEKRTEENAKDKALSESQEQKRRRCSAGCAIASSDVGRTNEGLARHQSTHCKWD